MKVKQFINKNQFVIEGEGKTIFQSYDSTIAKIEDNFLTLYPDWDYSKTTMKHLYLFLSEYRHRLCFASQYIVDKILSSSNKKQTINKMIIKGLIVVDYD